MSSHASMRDPVALVKIHRNSPLSCLGELSVLMSPHLWTAPPAVSTLLLYDCCGPNRPASASQGWDHRQYYPATLGVILGKEFCCCYCCCCFCYCCLSM